MKTRFFVDENNNLITLDTLMKEWEAEKETSEHNSFGEYLSSCMNFNGGTLTEVTNCMKTISVTTYYHTAGKYGYISYKGKEYTTYLFNLRENTENGKEIDWTGVNSVAVNEDENRIFQASGYSCERGIFCDLY